MTDRKDTWNEFNSLIPFKPCSSYVLAGPTGSGKSTFIKRFIQDIDGMYDKDPPVETLYCYDIHQDIYDTMERENSNLTFLEGLPSTEQLDAFLKDSQHRLLILDDMQNVIRNSSLVESLFTAGCHHRYLSVMYVTQNLFQQGTRSRTISLNAFYHILFPSTRDRGQIATLGRQLFWEKSKYFVKIYEDVLKNGYRYLIIDNTPDANPDYRLRTCIFPGEDVIVYQIP